MPRTLISAILTLFALLIASLSLSPAASARPQQGGFPDILGDIFGGQTPSPYGNAPISGAYIENIPVQVTFDSRPDLLPPGAMLVLTATAPPAPNVRRSSPLVIGETRLLISRLAPPLSLVIAVPSDMARELDYAQIDAKIIDASGNTAYRLDNSAQYSGGQPPFLTLEPVGALRPMPPGTGGPMPPYTPPKIEVIDARIELPAGSTLMRGSTLVLQVTEVALAGGTRPSIVKEERVDIDQKTAPFNVKLSVPTGTDGVLDSPQLTVFIEDWTGQKTFVYPRPVPVSPAQAGQRASVAVSLDPILTGSQVVPDAPDYILPSTQITPVYGKAVFDAWKGLPRDSVLTIKASDPNDLYIIFNEITIPLNGKSGHIDFLFEYNAATDGLGQMAPLLSAQITNASNQTLFTTRRLRSIISDANTIELVATPQY